MKRRIWIWILSLIFLSVRAADLRDAVGEISMEYTKETNSLLSTRIWQGASQAVRTIGPNHVWEYSGNDAADNPLAKDDARKLFYQLFDGFAKQVSAKLKAEPLNTMN